MLAYELLSGTENGSAHIWHSKADKIVNNICGQNPFQFHGQTRHSYGQNWYFCAQILQIFLISLHSISMTKFHAQNLFQSNDKFHAQNLFQSNDKIPYSKPNPFRWQTAQPHSIPAALPILKASHAFRLTCGVFRQFEPSLGTGRTATKAILHRRFWVTKYQTSQTVHLSLW